MRRITLASVLLFGLLNHCMCQISGNGKLYGKWVTCRLLDSAELGNTSLGLENLDSFTTSIRQIAREKFFNLKLDTVKNEETRCKHLNTFFTPWYNSLHGSWMEFCEDSTVIEHSNGDGDNDDEFINMIRTYEFNSKTNHLIMNKFSNSEELLVRILSDDVMILSFYKDDLNLLVRKLK